MVTSQILKSVDFTPAQKSKFFENEALLFVQIKKTHYLHIHQRLLYYKKQFCNGGNL